MLFNSYVFLFAFLPATLLGFWLLGRTTSRRAALTWLVACSLFFYGWWNPAFVLLILFSILFNYSMGVLLARAGLAASTRKLLLVVGISANLGLLAYFKYANFLAETVNAVLGTGWDLSGIFLPLAISFFTFQQIAFLVDVHRLQAREYNFVDYCLFVTFFPQLIAGPIVHHAEMLPQFAPDSIRRLRSDHLSVGITIFAIGLFKKVMLADNVAVYADAVFDTTDAGQTVTFVEAWIGTLAYTFQLYFDFSGYSDMAIGLARMFGVHLPVNFNSPLKATNMVDFWRRWHMTLSRFLRDYLYIPLGGNRRGKARRYVNLMVTMVLGGLWHGASWNFVIWGALQGLYMLCYHAWNAMRPRLGISPTDSGIRWWSARALTVLAYVFSMAFFRAEGLPSALSILGSMFGVNGFTLASEVARAEAGAAIGFLLLVAWLVPNTQQVMARFRPALGAGPERTAEAERLFGLRLAWAPSRAWSLVVVGMLLASVLDLMDYAEFIYWQF